MRVENGISKIYLSTYAQMIFDYLIKQGIKFSFCVLDLKNKEDEKSVLNKIDIKSIGRYQLRFSSMIDERKFYIIENI